MNPAAAANIYQNTMGKGAKSGVSGGDSFGAMVRDAALNSVDTLKKGEEMSAKAVMGTADLNDVVQAVTDAEVTLQTVVAMRDRMLSAYQEIMRMPI